MKHIQQSNQSPSFGRTMPRACAHRIPAGRQQGFTLIELLIGVTIGLLVIAVATGAMMASRNISGTVTDASDIQQQAAYAMRTIGEQLKQAGSLYLNLGAGSSSGKTNVTAPVAFEAKASGDNDFDLSNPEELISENNNTLTVGYRRYKERVFTSTDEQALARNCLGAPANSSGDERIENNFILDSTAGELKCGGNGSSAQAIIENVANFQTLYLVQGGSTSTPVVQRVPAASVSDWRKVQAVEICLVLYGHEAISFSGIPVADRSYADCDGTAVDMASLSGARKNRMHVVFRNVFQLRSQGLAG